MLVKNLNIGLDKIQASTLSTESSLNMVTICIIVPQWKHECWILNTHVVKINCPLR